jgi:hypothetical protein
LYWHIHCCFCFRNAYWCLDMSWKWLWVGQMSATKQHQCYNFSESSNCFGDIVRHNMCIHSDKTLTIKTVALCSLTETNIVIILKMIVARTITDKDYVRNLIVFTLQTVLKCLYFAALVNSSPSLCVCIN